MENINNIIFDLGGVILTLNMPETERLLSSHGITSYNQLFRSGNVSDFFEAYEVGKIDDGTFLQSLKKLTDKEVSDAQLIHAWNAMLGVFPEERISLLQSLKERYRLFLFSNTNALHVKEIRDRYTNTYRTRFDDLFEKTYYSNELGLRKPNVASFQHILHREGLIPSETAFVDDSLANVEAAEAAGIKGIHVKPGMTILDIPF